MIYIPGPVSSIVHHPHKLPFHARPGIQGFCGLAFHAFMFHDLFLTQYAHHIVIPCKTWYPGLLWFGVSCHHVSWFIPPTIHYTHIQGLSTHRMCLSFSDYYQLLSHANPLLDLPRDFGLGFNLRFGNTECGVFLAHGTIFASSWLDQWTGGLSLWPLGLWDRGSALAKAMRRAIVAVGNRTLLFVGLRYGWRMDVHMYSSPRLKAWMPMS